MSNAGISMKGQSGNNGTSAKRKYFYLSWLVLGTLQVLTASGCGQSASGADHLLSDDSHVSQSEERAGEAQAMPVRVSRAFFESPLKGELSLSGGSPEQGDVSWREFELENQGSAPAAGSGAVIADFHDTKGCATYAGGVELCFKLMGDVSNVGLNEREMNTSGLGAWIDRQLGQPCPGAQWDARFLRAERDRQGQGIDGSFTVTYEVKAEGCSAGARQVQLKLTRV
jgi:hypothetical protein